MMQMFACIHLRMMSKRMEKAGNFTSPGCKPTQRPEWPRRLQNMILFNSVLPNTRHPANIFSQAVCGLCWGSFHTSSKVK